MELIDTFFSSIVVIDRRSLFVFEERCKHCWLRKEVVVDENGTKVNPETLRKRNNAGAIFNILNIFIVSI